MELSVRGVAAGAAALAMVAAIGGCGTSKAATTPVQRAPKLPNIGQALKSIPATPGNLSQISIVNAPALWEEAGLPAEPTAAEILHSPRAQLATVEAFDASPVGSAQWRGLTRGQSSSYTAALGYPVLGMTKQITAGPASSQVSEAWGPISAASVVQATHRAKRAVSTTGESTVLTFGQGANRDAGYPYTSVLADTHYLVLPVQGGSIVSGSYGTPESQVVALAAGTDLNHSLGSNPAVQGLMHSFGNRYDSIWMAAGDAGGSIHGVLGKVPVELKAYLVAPEMIGVAYLRGSVNSPTVKVAAYYPDPADAVTASHTVGRYMASGYSRKYNKPYRDIWHVLKADVDGNVAYVTLKLHSPATLYDSLQSQDLPLFWAP